MELDDKKHFLSQCPPFSLLEASSLDLALSKLEISYAKAGSVLAREQLCDELYLLRSGSLEVKFADGELADRLSSGDTVGYPLCVHQQADWARFKFLEDSLLYCFPKHCLLQLMSSEAGFCDFFEHQQADRLRNTLGGKEQDYRLHQKVSELMVSAPLCSPQTLSIVDVAKQMSAARVSSILIVDDEQLSGILTDRDLRSRVLAGGIHPDTPVSEVMTRSPKVITRTHTVYDAQLLMMMANIHHLPVVDDQRPVGIITLNDFIRAQNSEPVFMIQAIHRARQRETLYHISKQLPEMICKMIRANVRAEEIGRIITSVTDSITCQLLTLAQQVLGEAPCDWAWVAFGSQAREDQMLGSDQDNGLILDNDASDAQQAYFLKLAEFVNAGLDKSGLRYCPGDIMAKTDKWRQPLSEWQAYFKRWIRQPEPKALMHASIFYDVRHIDGKRVLTQTLVDTIANEAKQNTIFQACMCENALQSSPPLGFFKTFVLERDGDHNPSLDLKHRGTVPIVAMVRLYCLASGIRAANTCERLKQLEDQGVLSHTQTQNLRDAHEFIASLRLESQNDAMSLGQTVSNSLNPDALSPLVRHQLKDAFSVVAESQRLLKMRFGHGAI